jgi:hypothetical protein
MNDTQAILAAQRQEFSRWEDMLAGINEETAAVFHPSAGMSIKDVVAHLMAWQQLSIARLEAARLNREPALPDWLAGEDPESEEHIDQFNATIQATYAPRPWAAVHQAWRDGYRRLVALAEETPPDDLMAAGKYPWLNGNALLDVVLGSLEHHVEHAEALLWNEQMEH